jgi:capsular exopolysaccharide synthesis family protein
VRKHWATAVASALAVCLSVTFYTLGQKRIYQAVASVQFDPTPPRPLGNTVATVVDMGAGEYWNNREYYETQYKVIQSMRLAISVAHQLDLGHDAGFMTNAPPGTPVGRASATPEEAALVLRSRLSVDPVKESRLANVKYEDADPQRAQRILATLVDMYVDQNLEDALASTSSAVDWLTTQLSKLKGELESSEMALHDYKITKNILSVAFDDQSNMLREQMKQINEALTQVRAKREELTARSTELMKVSAESVDELPASELLQSVLLQSLRQRYQEAVRDRDGFLASGKGTSHPEVREAEAKVATSKGALLAEVRNIQGAIQRDLAVVERQESGLSNLFNQAKAQALDLNLSEIEYNRLRRTKDNTEKLYSLVLERTKESDLTRMLRVNNIRVLDRPLLPGSPIRPRVPVNIAFGICAGLVIGLGAALARAMLDRTIKTPDDAERDLGTTFLGLLPEIDRDGKSSGYYARRRGRKKTPKVLEGRPELFVHAQPSSGLAEASRAIRTNLLFMAPDQPFRTLLITSAAPAEGKTTVACCIAIAMAQAGQRVVLVDCDLRRPRLHRIFGKSSNSGVTTALLGTDPLDEDTLSTEVPNLSVIPAGPIPPNPAELLHSAKFKGLIAELGSRFDRVILDSPPVVAVTDAAVLSTLADGALLVVRAFSTTRDLARHGVRALQDVGGKVAGVVLNAVNLDRHEYKYYHYYYYKRGDYYTSNTADNAPADTSASA